MARKRIRRGDIYYADLRPVVGSEQGGIRPVVILQNNTGNQFSPTTIAAALTSRILMESSFIQRLQAVPVTREADRDWVDRD